MLNGAIMNRNSGFTLVEMMITVVIIAILLAIGVPSFQTFIENTKIRSTVESMQAGLHLARTEAMRRNARVSLWLVNNLTAACAQANTGASWVVSQDNPAGACANAVSDSVAPRIIQTRARSDGSNNINIVALDTANAASNCITFNGFGGVETACTGGGNPISQISVASATLGASTRDLQVRITPGGAVRTCDPDVTNGATGC